MKAQNLVNLTLHAIKLNSGLVIEPSGKVLRAADIYTIYDTVYVDNDMPCDSDIVVPAPYEFEVYQLDRRLLKDFDLPEPKFNTIYIVSGAMLQLLSDMGIARPDIMAPATGSTTTVRDNKGQIVSVPGFYTLMESFDEYE